MAKTMCSHMRNMPHNIKKVTEIVKEPQFICKKCAHVSRKDKYLCKPIPII
jgi:hypothetical protein